MFHCYFLDQFISSHYESYLVVLIQIILCTTIATFLKVAKKSKKIGTRKVFGGGEHHNIAVPLYAIIKQAHIGTSIGIPLAWFLANRYFESFTERNQLKWGHFSLPVLAFGVMLLITVFFRLGEVKQPLAKIITTCVNRTKYANNVA